MLDFSRQYTQIRDEVLTAIERVCDSQQYILGSAVTDFERRTTEFLGVNAAVGCAFTLALVAFAAAGPGTEETTTTPAPHTVSFQELHS